MLPALGGHVPDAAMAARYASTGGALDMRNHPANDGLLIAVFRWARLVGRQATNRYRRTQPSEQDSMEHLVQLGVVREDEPGEYYLDEAVVDDWMRDPLSPSTRVPRTPLP